MYIKIFYCRSTRPKRMDFLQFLIHTVYCKYTSFKVLQKTSWYLFESFKGQCNKGDKSEQRKVVHIVKILMSWFPYGNLQHIKYASFFSFQSRWAQNSVQKANKTLLQSALDSAPAWICVNEHHGSDLALRLILLLYHFPWIK